MTDLPPQSRANAKPKAKSAGYLRLVLGLSLAANLAVAGFVLGMALDGGRHGPHGMGRDMAFGPFTRALAPADRRALSDSLLEKAPRLGDLLGQMAADLASGSADEGWREVHPLLAEPFDPAALDAAFAAHSTRVAANMALGQGTLRDFLIGMDAEKRIDFANRLRGQANSDRDQ